MIYIVDDDAAVRESLQFLLEVDGFEVAAFDSGEAFLQSIKGINGQGCVVLDLQMPGLNGQDVLRSLRARQSELHVVVISGDMDEMDRRNVSALGAQAVFDKPFDPNLLCASVKDALAPKARSLSAL